MLGAAAAGSWVESGEAALLRCDDAALLREELASLLLLRGGGDTAHLRELLPSSLLRDLTLMRARSLCRFSRRLVETEGRRPHTIGRRARRCWRWNR